MLSAIPLPDFDTTDDISDFYSPLSSPVMPPNSSLASREHANVLGSRGLTIASSCPIRCTANSTVYKVQSANGSYWAAKLTSAKLRLIAEFAKREHIPASPFLVQMAELVETSTTAVLLMELCEGGDLVGTHLPEPEAWQLLNNVAVALADIHATGWIHLDVSPGNILRKDGVFKLADFGTLSRIGAFHGGDEGAGPYVSPEALEFPHGAHGVGAPTDVFSLGVVMLEVLTGRKAPRGGSRGYGELRTGRMRLGEPAYESDASAELQEVVNRMLAANPLDRPTAAELVDITYGV